MANGVELATAYVQLVPSAQGIAGSIAKELAPVQAAAAKTGAGASKSLSSSLLGGLQGVSGKLVAGLGFASIGVAAFRSAEDVENAKNTIIRATGATGKAADSLTASFETIAAKTPASFQTVAEALAEVHQRTDLTGKSLETLTLQVVTFNRITKDAPLNVKELTQVLAAFNVPAEQMGTELDHLFVVAQKSGVPLAELITTLGDAGPLARQFGLGLDAFAQLVGNLSKTGIPAQQVIGGLKRVFIEAAKAGVEPREELKRIIEQIHAFTQAGEDAKANDLAANMFGARGIGLVDAVKSGKLALKDLNDFLPITGKGILDTAGSTGTLAGKLGILKNQAKLALAEFGTPLLTIGTDALAKLIPIATTLGGVLHDFAPEVTAAALAFGAMYLSGKLLVPLLGFVAAGLDKAAIAAAGVNAERSFAGFAGASSVVTGFSKALPGLAAGGVLVASSFDEMGKSAGPTVEGIAGMAIAGGAVGSVIPGVGTAVGALGGAAIGAGVAFGQWASNTETMEDKLKGLDKAAHELTGHGKELVVNFIDKLIPAAEKANPDLQGSAISMAAFRSVAEASVGTAARLAKEFEGSPLGKGFDLILRNVSSAQKQLNTDQQQGTLIAQGYTQATAEQTSALQDLQSVVLAASGGQIGYEQSVLNVQKAQSDYNDAVAQFGPDSEQARDALLNLKSAQNQAAGATLALDQQQAALQAKYADTAAVDAAIASLQQQQQEYPATADSLNPLIFQLLTLKAKYEDVNASPPVELHISAPGLAGTYQDLVNFKAVLDQIATDPNLQGDQADPIAGIIGLRASGGPVAFGSPYLVGETGPELFVPDAAGTIIPHRETAAILAGSSSSSSGETWQLFWSAPAPDPVTLKRDILKKRRTASHLAGTG